MTAQRLGKYRLIAELGRGGMGEVFLAVTDEVEAARFNKLVVIKKLRSQLTLDKAFVTMFVEEGRIAARLNHPNVVQTFEVDVIDDEPLLAMEYLEGQSLHHILARAGRRIPLAMHLRILSDVLAGIAYAHELQDFDGKPLRVVHRDVTPHNVFVTYDGQVKVLDFGIAKAAGRAIETRHGVIKGKVPYMSPEQARTENVDARTDVFAVGVMLFEACTRQRMWAGKTDKEILATLVKSEPLPSPRSIDDRVDPELDRICVRALAPRAPDRYASADAMQADLDAFLAKSPAPRPKAIGAWVSAHFEEERAGTREIIEAQLTDLGSSSPARAALPPEKKMSDSAIHIRTVTSSQDESTEPTAPAATPERPTNRSRLPILIVAVAAAFLLAMVIRGRPSERAEEITLTLRAVPLEATFRVDDGARLDNPHIVKVPRGRRHVIVAEAPGHAPLSKTIEAQDDESLRFELAKLPDDAGNGK